MSGFREFKGPLVWMSRLGDGSNRSGVAQRAILRASEIVMDVLLEGREYSVKLQQTGGTIYQGHWEERGTSRRGLAECTVGPVLRTLGIDMAATEEPGILEIEGRWVEDGDWQVIGRLNQVDIEPE